MAPETAPTPASSAQLLTSVPDLADEPLDAPWLRRRRAAEVEPPVVDLGRRDISAEPDGGRDREVERPSSPTRIRRRRRFLRGLVVVILLAVLALGGILIHIQRQFSAIERVEVAGLLAPASPGGTNYLIVGSDSRENLDPTVENAGAIFGDGSEEIGGQRTDTIQILRIANDGSQHMLALPRDLYVPIGGDGASDRINAAYAFGGPELLIETVEGSLGIPVHHYAEIDFGGFIDVVDAVGGVTIDFPHPAYDLNTGLNVPEAGPTTLDSTQALAFVRSRYYTELIDGQAVLDPRGDLGRVKRQQIFLQALFEELGDPRDQVSVLVDLDTVASSIKLDDRVTFGDALGVVNQLRDLNLNSEWDLAVHHAITADGAQVLQLDAAASQPILDFFSR